MIQMRNRYGIICLSIFTLFQAASCLLIRYGARYKKDNYKLAATIASDSLRNGETVLWNVNLEGALYYHLPVIMPSPDQRFYINKKFH